MSAPTPFVELARASAALAATRSRTAKKAVVVALLGRLAPREVAPAVGWLVEDPVCGRLGVGYAHLWAMSHGHAPPEPSVTIDEVEATLAAAAGSDRAETLARVDGLYERLTEPERALFRGSLTATLRQGSLGGIMILALAEVRGVDEAAVRRAVMVSGSVVRAADALLGPERAEAPPASLELFRPLAPMLASSAKTLEDALDQAPDATIEWKLDGVRAQVHKHGERITIFSRGGNDITAGCAPLVAALARLPCEDAVLDGEVVLEDATGAMRPFQDTFSAVAKDGVGAAGDRLRIYLFDVLHLDGADLLDAPLRDRAAAVERLAPDEMRVPRIAGGDRALARRFYDEAIAFGHEGVMVKDLGSTYRFGARGKAWQKVKEHTTVDLVVLAVERGSGRRSGFLSNLHLGARRDDGSFCMVGKTFKGLTDELLAWQTERLGALATSTEGHVVHVRPELVVEIRFNDVQRSSRYPGGVALRFARVVRYRDDKKASEADLLADLVARCPEPPAGEPARGAGRKRGAKAARDAAAARQLSLFED